MLTQGIRIDDILIEDSRFSIKPYIFEQAGGPSCHLTSFDTLGILYPIIVYEDDRRDYHLIDGRKRLVFARDSMKSTIIANILPSGTPVTDIISLVFCNRRNEIQSSVVNRVQFICYACSLSAPEKWITGSLCVPFEFRPHAEFINECERIYSMPERLRRFAHEKKLSLKQLINLSCYPADLLSLIVEWTDTLQLTASIMDEMASNLRSYLRREGISVREFIRDPEVQEIIESSMSPKAKTEKLRRLIYLRQFPVLSATNQKIREIVDSAGLPEEVRITWDETLENHGLGISISVDDPEKWKTLLERLRTPGFQDMIRKMLDEL
jgi:hypothetical protein